MLEWLEAVSAPTPHGRCECGVTASLSRSPFQLVETPQAQTAHKHQRELPTSALFSLSSHPLLAFLSQAARLPNT